METLNTTTHDLPKLSPETERLLSQVGHYRLTDDELLQLKLHLRMIPSWAARVPESTRFFFVQWQPVLVLPRIAGFTRSELAIASYLQPLHSQLCALALQVLWKADQLARTLCDALNAGHMIVAATMARSLIETAAAFGCETDQIAELWRKRKLAPAPDTDSLIEFQQKAKVLIGQILFGTKLKRDKVPETGIERINILTLVDKAEKLAENPGLRRIYDVLCDTVHPSVGSNRCFWTQEPKSKDGPIFEFVTARKATGVLSDLPVTTARGALWSLVWLGWMWNLFDRTRRDICLTARIYALPASYYGIVRPGDPSGYCSCGSDQREEFCRHEFGDG
jgi:hypothetical protein